MKNFLLGVATSLSMLNIGNPAEWRNVTIFMLLSFLIVYEVVFEKEKNV
jgi:hypothetical protein